ncbi:coiled-coil domain-containing protein 115 [Neosynchiropus ocellatus]
MELSVQLDEKLLVFMEQLETLEQKRAAANSLTEQGWFCLSQARYSMGHKRVSALQFASEMEPLVRVQSRTLQDGATEWVADRRPSETGAAEVEDVGPKEGVRRRAGSKTPSEGDPEDTQLPPRRRDSSPRQDPLKWFGILVPQTLKQAQTSFKQAIELSAQIATLQARLLKTRQELQNLLQRTQVSGSPTEPGSAGRGL